MKEKNRLLVRSRDRTKWKKNLAGKNKNEAKAEAIYFRPSLGDDRQIRELAELTGETNNAIVEKLISCALHNRAFTSPKLTEQKNAIRRLEEQTDLVMNSQVEILSLLDEMRRQNSTVGDFMTTMLAEIYCMVHTAVSLLRTALLQIIGLTQRETGNTQLSPEVLASFDETSDLTIARSLQDLESAAAYHQIKTGKLTEANLFWKSKLKRANEEPQQK